jgi:hypothetical protein
VHPVWCLHNTNDSSACCRGGCRAGARSTRALRKVGCKEDGYTKQQARWTGNHSILPAAWLVELVMEPQLSPVFRTTVPTALLHVPAEPGMASCLEPIITCAANQLTAASLRQ